MNFKKGLNQIFSNKTVENVPGVKYMGTRGKDGVGIHSNMKDAKKGYKEMNKAGEKVTKYEDKISEGEKALKSLKKQHKAGQVPEEDVLAQKANIEAWKGKRDKWQTRTDEAQKGMIDSGLDSVKGVGRYFGATDYRGKSGRGMAIGMRAAAGGTAYMAGATALSAAQGGGLTYNNQGERDIAGIPFL